MHGHDHVHDFDPMMKYHNLPYDVFKQLKISDYEFQAVFVLHSPLSYLTDAIVTSTLRSLRESRPTRVKIICYSKNCDTDIAFEGSVVPSIVGINKNTQDPFEQTRSYRYNELIKRYRHLIQHVRNGSKDQIITIKV